MNIFSEIYNLSLLTISGLSVFKAVRYGFKKQFFLSIYLLITLVVEVNAIIHIKWFSTTNTYTLYQHYALFCIIFFGYYYYRIFPKTYRYLVLIILIIAFILSILMINFGLILSFGLGMIVSIVYVLYALLWYHYGLNNNLDKKISDNPHFWISSGLLFWGSFYVLKAYPAEYLIDKDPSFHTVLKNINYIVATIMYVLIGVGLLKFNKQKV
jgi:hypothetical protein